MLLLELIHLHIIAAPKALEDIKQGNTLFIDIDGEGEKPYLIFKVNGHLVVDYNGILMDPQGFLDASITCCRN